MPSEAAPEPPPPVGPHPLDAPWGVRDVWLGLGLLVLCFVGIVAFALFNRSLDLGLLVSLGEAIMIVPVVLLVFVKHRAGLAALGLRRFPPRMMWVAFGLLFLAGIFNAAYGLLLNMAGLQVQASLQQLLDQLKSPWWFAVGAAVVAPLVEETFFRGFVYGGFRKRYGWVRAAVFSSILFALFHGEWTAFLPIFLLGMIFAYLYERSGAIWPGMVLHVTNNSLTLLVVFLALHYHLPI
jgi:CAAX protease family protein